MKTLLIVLLVLFIGIPLIMMVVAGGMMVSMTSEGLPEQGRIEPPRMNGIL